MPDSFEKIDRLLRNTCTEETPGLSVLVQKHGEIYLKESYGICDIASRLKIDSKTCFNIASLTKQFTAFGILLLEAANKISLHQKLSDFFPQYNKKTGEQVTVLQLLMHSSGLPDHYPYINTHIIKHTTDNDVLNAIQDIETTCFVPGTMYRYSNTAYCLLALIIQSASGMPYDLFLQKQIFNPTGMASSFFRNKQKANSNIASGYEADADSGLFHLSGPDQNIFFTTEGDGGLYTSIDDYSKWLNALRNPGIFHEELTGKSRRPLFFITGYENLCYGFGWFIDTSNAHAKIQHSGSNGGYRSYCFTLPAEDYHIVLFSNRSDLQLEQLAFAINEWLVPGYAPFTAIDRLTS